MKPIIESLQNPKVKNAIRLRDSRARRKSGLIIIDGLREIGVALRAGVEIETIFTSTDSETALPEDLLQPVTTKVMDKLGYGDRAEAVAVARLPQLSLEPFTAAVRRHTNPLIVVLDRAEKPGNIGAVVRTVATAGAQGLVLVDPQCEVFNPNAIRASLGTIFSVPVAVASLPQLSDWLVQQHIGLVRACVDGQRSMWSCDLSGPLAIALGSEAWGLGPEWDRPGWLAVQIPMATGSDSLNLSVSAAVLCYEALRQRLASHPIVE